MREYKPYQQMLNQITFDAVRDISRMFKETDTEEIILSDPVRMFFKPRWAGDSPCVCTICRIDVKDTFIRLSSEEVSYWLYDLANCEDKVFVYEIVYHHLNKN
jgi:hypothetical protein